MKENSLKKKRSYGPDVRLVQHGETLLVEKTYRNSGLPVRIAGFFLVSWERFIYSKIQGMAGIPRLISSPDRYTLMTHFMGGHNLRETGINPDDDYFRALTRLIEEMHSRGVIHLDLRNRRNYGIDEEGNPYLVDFASSLYIPFSKTLVKIFAFIDWMGFVKVKERLCPTLISEKEEKLLSIGNTLSSWWLPTKALRMLRDIVRKIRA